ncbi:Gfo/Idh/MocA family protein [Mesorhizobium amorphae]|uniref:Oxidoreductase domain-containing protein n=2 Tax=Mesorhizobium amorphae TaxID=71433 RepID=G6Y8H6_9HYPH|nr:Gfo/Idh/MocA family oxidoreductase [Mesorhizobium amorphae]EHH11997.1 oxidoreductase domain-containing protein [Mesorhizobium amorphae CCNWGS0123]
MNKVRVGVVGMGLGRHHVATYAASEHVAEIVLVDKDPPRLESIRSANPKVTSVYYDIAEMLASEALDGVSVATPDQFHLEHATAVIEAGRNLLLTKPIACNLRDAETIVGLAERRGVKLMIAHEARYRSRSRALKQMVQEGFFGDIIHIRMDAIHDKRKQFAESPWYASAEAGRTATIGTGIHEIDFLRFLIDRPVLEVNALSNNLGTLAFPKPKTISAIFQFEGGAIGQTLVTYEARWDEVGEIDDGFRLIGTEGMAVGHKATRDGLGAWIDLPRDEDEVRAGTEGVVNSFIGSIANDDPIAVTGQDALVSLRLCDTVDRVSDSLQHYRDRPAA